jgi:hypothetical protein
MNGLISCRAVRQWLTLDEVIVRSILAASLFVLGGCASSNLTSDSGIGAGINEFYGGSRAAVKAAALANDACDSQFHCRPFKANTFPAKWDNGVWRWGNPDPAGPGGFSAEVSFTGQGTDTHVRIWYMIDMS